MKAWLVWSVLLLAILGGVTWAIIRTPATEPVTGGPPTERLPAPAPSNQPEDLAPVLERERVQAATPAVDEQVGSAASSALIRVRVRAIDSVWADEPEFIPGVGIALGVGDENGSRQALAEGITDPGGLAEFEIEWRDEWARPEPRPYLWAQVQGAGLQQHSAHLEVPLHTPSTNAPLELRVEASRGATARGVVLSAEGSPTKAVLHVEWFDKTGEWRHLAYEHTNGNGVFEVHVPGSGEFRILARGTEPGGRGSAVTDSTHIGLEAPPQDLALQLHGPGVVRGQVLDGLDQPAAGVELLVLTAELEARSGRRLIWSVGGESGYVETEHAAEGLQARTTVTDAMGRFVFRGLREDLYHVRTRKPAAESIRDRSDFGHLLTSRPVPSDGSDVLLRFDRSYLRVRVLNHDQEPIPVEAGHPHSSLGDEWPDSARVLVEAAGDQESVVPIAASAPIGQPGSLGEVVFDVLQGLEYVVSVVGPGRQIQERRIVTPVDPGPVEVEFVQSSLGQTGFLEVKVRDPNGAPLREGVTLHLLDPATGIKLIQRNVRAPMEAFDVPSVKLELPAGDYLVQIELQPRIRETEGGGVQMIPKAFGDQRFEVSVLAGKSTPLEARFQYPAYLELSLAGSVSEADRAAIAKQHPDFVGNVEFASMLAAQPFVSLRGSTGPSMQVLFAPDSDEGVAVWSPMTLGTTGISVSLAPGPWLLEVQLPGGRSFERRIDLVSGQTLRIEHDFGEP